jgi:orotidine-5'-phosphate decarboxylase
VQLALGREGSVAQEIIDAAQELNSRARTRAVGLVVGRNAQALGCDVSGFNASILVPGIGAQGGRIEDLPGMFGPAHDKVLPMVGRAILQAGPDPEALHCGQKWRPMWPSELLPFRLRSRPVGAH